MYTCCYCERSCVNKGGLSAHEPHCSKNPNRISRNTGVPKGNIPWNKGKHTGQIPWNKGLTHQDHPNIGNGKALTEEKERLRCLKISKSMKMYGGYRKGSGRGKKGWYKGIFCDSSWELAYVIFCLDHDVPIKRNAEKFKYIFEGKEHTYIPDFLVYDEIIEIKGFVTSQWNAKIICNPHIRVLYNDEMKPILSYVKEKYGKRFTDLYERDK